MTQILPINIVFIDNDMKIEWIFDEMYGLPSPKDSEKYN